MKIKTELTREDHSHRSDYHWRCTQANDHEKLNAAYNRFTGQNRTLEQYLWQWVKTPFEPSESWVLEYTRTGEIVGHHGVMYLPFTQRGESIGGGKTENTFIDRHHAPKVFYLALEKKALQAMQNRFVYIYTTAPYAGKGAVGLIRKKLGYQPLGVMATCCLQLRPSAVKTLMQERYPQLSRVAGPLAIGQSMVQGFIWLVNALRSVGVQVKDLSWENLPAVSEFWEKHKSCYGVTVDRTLAYLRWRLQENPYITYSLVEIRHQTKVLGYAVLKERLMPVNNEVIEIMSIEDLIVAQAREENFFLCLAALNRKYLFKNVIVKTLLQDDALNRAIRRLQHYLRKWYVKPGPELLAWSREGNAIPWYFTNILLEGII